MGPKKDKQVAGRCVFCNGTGLSKEHVFSDWLKEHIPTVPGYTETAFHTQFDPIFNEAFVTPVIKNHQGGPNRRKVRNVCSRCNSGWMSGIVARAKTFVSPMMYDAADRIAIKEQRDVAAWIALTTIMAEFSDSVTQAIPVADRKSVWVNEEPPDSFTILVGRYDGTEWSSGMRYRHHSAAFLSPWTIRIDSANPDKLQVTTIALRSLLFQCFSSTSRVMVSRFRSRHLPRKMAQIWPPVADLDWPSMSKASDVDATTIADDAFWRLQQS